MASPMSTLSPEKLNANPHAMQYEDDLDIYDEGPSSPFLENVEHNQENVAPSVAVTPAKQQLIDFENDNVPQSASRVEAGKKAGLKERSSPLKKSPVKNLLEDFEDAAVQTPNRSRASTLKSSPVKQHIVADFEGATTQTPNRSRAGTVSGSPAKSPARSYVAEERPDSSMSNRTRKSRSPSKSSVLSSVPSDFDVEATPRAPSLGAAIDLVPTSSKRPSPSQTPSRHSAELRDNEGLTVAANRFMEDADIGRSHKRRKSHENPYEVNMEADITEFNPDATTPDIDDTHFSDFSEMPGLDMTKFASFRKSPTKKGDATPRARAQMTPSTVRRSERTPSPTPRRSYRDNDTTNLLLDFTAQIESFAASRNGTPSHANGKPTTEPNLRSYYQNKRSPAKGGYVPATPGQNRPLLNLLDFELPPPPTPRSLPTVTIREMESAKSQFQSQISSLTASLSGKEAEVESLSRAVADAERRVGEAQETVRDERSAREYAEAQMEDWKKKGEEVQTILQDVQSELARNDEERDQFLARLAEAEKRAEDAENRSTELETRLIEAESKNVDMTTFINNDEDENKKIYSEMECQSAIAEKVNEVARDLHAAYKAKHEKKIKALKDNYQKKADERCKELRVQITRLERQIGDAEDKRDDTFSKFEEFGSKSNGPCETCAKNAAAGPVSSPEDIHNLEVQRSEIENLKAKLAGLQSELHSLRKSQQILLEELEAERVEKGELVAAAEQMLVLCGEKMESMQQEDFRRSQAAPAQPPLEPRPTSKPTRQQPAPEQAMRNTGFLAGGSSVSSSASRPGSSLSSSRPGDSKPKPSGMRAPGGFGFKAVGESALSRSQSGAGKSRLLSNIERMGNTKGQE
ncbi:hypothetical protein BU25DRAFT_405449 [Macroventuria anomochaeta]|uniref:Uncharacterized protein n=1 Tax=Macroventuria anomochaeta TaxID=301207 RepID=A0ACB6SJG3_9PLEO|nr:uncharacterized protein BU25DRAFT_405449 [Macroventuria anomochaeta]KAF2633584.1 hypothetical protein BU25DRAFT_405449 [Macroventuria anomochaeta]